jgi:predicted SAM-dependent methyltransferase
MSTTLAPALRLHFGCGPKLLDGWVNIDRVANDPSVRTDISLTCLPWADASVDEILAEHVFEHFTFAEEQAVWQEVARVLRPGGTLTIEVPDFEWVCTTFLGADDNFIDFYRVGPADHYAGHGRALDQRWGILQTMVFGNQNGAGQFHHSAYTSAKLHALADMLGFQAIAVATLFNKGGQALRAVLTR